MSFAKTQKLFAMSTSQFLKNLIKLIYGPFAQSRLKIVAFTRKFETRKQYPNFSYVLPIKLYVKM